MSPNIKLTIVLAGDRLTPRLAALELVPLVPLSDTKFRIVSPIVELEFITNEAGLVTHVVRRQNGEEFGAPRLKERKTS